MQTGTTAEIDPVYRQYRDRVYRDKNIIGINSRTAADSMEVTILADRTIPFSVLKKIMSSCTLAGYEKISMAVIQKSSNG